MYINKIVGDITPHKMIEVYYDRAKNICKDIYDKPKADFEDLYHQTLYNCLKTLGDKVYSQDYLRGYLFKAFRLNMIRHYLYAFNREKSGMDFEQILIPSKNIDIDTHIDGFQMMDFVKQKYGEEIKEMLWE